MIRITLSRKLGELRMTQADLARKTGIRPNTINDYYHEMAERISLEHFDLICQALNCDLSEILEYHPNIREHCLHPVHGEPRLEYAHYNR